VSVPAWLRFAELSLLAAWVIWRAYAAPKRPRGAASARKVDGSSRWRSGHDRAIAAAPVALAGLLALAQLVLVAQTATDPFTPLLQMLPVLLGSVFGGLSLAAAVLGLALAAWLWRTPGAVLATALAAAVLALAGASSVTAAEAVSAAASSGEIVMSPTLTVPRSAITTPNPYATDPDSVNRGRAVYQQYCVTCHGLNGDGNGPAVAGLRVRPPSFHNPQHYLAPGMDGAHYWVIQHGDGVPGGMPAWQGTLTAQQTWDVLNYIKSIAAETRR
jgi:mono/diheme cytochrome c family protein